MSPLVTRSAKKRRTQQESFSLAPPKAFDVGFSTPPPGNQTTSRGVCCASANRSYIHAYSASHPITCYYSLARFSSYTYHSFASAHFLILYILEVPNLCCIWGHDPSLATPKVCCGYESARRLLTMRVTYIYFRYIDSTSPDSVITDVSKALPTDKMIMFYVRSKDTASLDGLPLLTTHEQVQAVLHGSLYIVVAIEDKTQ